MSQTIESSNQGKTFSIENLEKQRFGVLVVLLLTVGCLAGIAVGFYKKGQISQNWMVDRAFEPSMTPAERKKLYRGWQKAVERTMKWEEE